MQTSTGAAGQTSTKGQNMSAADETSKKRDRSTVLADDKKTLLFAAQQIEDIYTSCRVEDLDRLASGHVVLHKDSIMLSADVHGIDNLKKYYQAFFSRYDYKHAAICYAVNVEKRTVFVLTMDDDVKPKEDKMKSVPEEERGPSRSLGIFSYTFDSDGKVHDIWFLRQPSQDEIARKFVSPPNYSGLDIKPEALKGPKLEADEARAKTMRQNAQAFSDIWKDGDVSSVSKIMTEDVRDANLLLGGEKQGREAFAEMIKQTFKVWRPSENHDCVAVDEEGLKAFIWWSAKGTETDKDLHDEMYGMNLLVFDQQTLQIKQLLGFRQPLASERPKMLKEDAKKAS